MIKRLFISNFALINEMDVTFPGKLTVITGETGAGKSIFLEALGLVLGNRADLNALRNRSKKCVVEAEFDIGELDLKNFFENEDLDYDPTLILRREINAEGKSRSFLNDTPVSLQVLKSIPEKLIDINSQHQTLQLNQANFQMEMVDAFAGSLNVLKQYKKIFAQLSKAKNHLSELEAQEAQAKKELDYIQFLYNELDEAHLKVGDLKALEEESLMLENAEMIKNSLANANTVLLSGEVNVLNSLTQVKQTLQSLNKFGNKYQELFERLNSSYIELKDISTDLENAENLVNVDNQKLDALNNRIDLLNRLLKKHNVKQEEDLIKIKVEIEEKLTRFGSLENEIDKTKKQILSLEKETTSLAKELTLLRKSAVVAIEKETKSLLAELSMLNAQFKVELGQLTQLNSTGLDSVKFMFSANKGGDLSELHKVASGGELSRLMLSLKSLLATKKKIASIVFDEIDTGVSGDVADKIGSILQRMGENMQVVVITHLPQMASKGQHHLFVYKEDDSEQTVSFIKELSADERTLEVAKMLSTGQPTAAALSNARELLNFKK